MYFSSVDEEQTTSGYFNTRKFIIRTPQNPTGQASKKPSKRQEPQFLGENWRHDNCASGQVPRILGSSPTGIILSTWQPQNFIVLHLLLSASINLDYLLPTLNQLIHSPYVSFPFNHHFPCWGRVWHYTTLTPPANLNCVLSCVSLLSSQLWSGG